MMPMGNAEPAVSTLFVTRHRTAQLRETLRAFCTLTYGDIRLAILVADNGSRDATADVLTDFSDSLPLVTRYTRQSGKIMH